MTIVLIISTVILVIINVYIGLRNRAEDNIETFISYKNKVKTIPIALSLLGTIIGGGMFFSIGEMGYQAGIAPLVIPFSYVVGFALLGIVIKKIKFYTKEKEINTLYDIVDMKLSKSNKWNKIYNTSIASINTIIYFFMLAGQFLILVAFYKYFFNISENILLLVSVIIVGLSILVYSVLGGLKKDIATDIYQSLWLILIFVLLIVYLAGYNNVFLNFDSLPNKLVNGMGYGMIFPIGVILFFSPAFIGRYDFIQRMISSKNEKSAKSALWISVPIIFVAYIIFIYLGMYARANANNEIVENVAVLWSLESIVPTWLFAIISVGLYAAVMSTADTLLNVTSVSLWRLKQSFSKSNYEEIDNMIKIKKQSLFIGILSILIIFIARSVVTVIIGSFSSLAVFAPSILYILYAKQPNAKLATISLIFPYILFLFVFIFFESLRTYAFVPAVILSIFIILFYLLFSKIFKKN